MLDFVKYELSNKNIEPHILCTNF
jgi:hypothetical protein